MIGFMQRDKIVDCKGGVNVFNTAKGKVQRSVLISKRKKGKLLTKFPCKMVPDYYYSV